MDYELYRKEIDELFQKQTNLNLFEYIQVNVLGKQWFNIELKQQHVDRDHVKIVEERVKEEHIEGTTQLLTILKKIPEFYTESHLAYYLTGRDEKSVIPFRMYFIHMYIKEILILRDFQLTRNNQISPNPFSLSNIKEMTTDKTKYTAPVNVTDVTFK